MGASQKEAAEYVERKYLSGNLEGPRKFEDVLDFWSDDKTVDTAMELAKIVGYKGSMPSAEDFRRLVALYNLARKAFLDEQM